MYKRLLALIPVLVFVCALSIPVHADSLVSTQALHFRCSKCSYTSAVGSFAWVDDTADMTCPKCGGKLGIYQGATFISGGGVTRGGGAGRSDGYVGNGIPTYSKNGDLQYVCWPDILVDGVWRSYPYDVTHTIDDGYYSINGESFYICSTNSSGICYFSVQFRFPVNAPVSGLYYIASDQIYFSNFHGTASLIDFTYEDVHSGEFSKNLVSGSTYNFTSSSHEHTVRVSGRQSYTATITPIVFTVVPSTSNVSSSSSVTINNNTFNGNVYVDNSTNLTYIYNDNSSSCIVYNNTTNQYVTYDQTTNNYYYITVGGDPSDYPTPTPDPSPEPVPTGPVDVGDSQSFEVNGGTSLTGSVSAKAGDYILATVSARSDITIPDSMTVLKIGDYVTASSGTKQAMSFAYEQVQEDGTYTYTFKQATSSRMYLNLIVLSNIDGLQYSGKYHTTGNGTSSLSVPDKSSGDLLVWGCSAITWNTTYPSGLWSTSPNDLTYVGLSDASTQPRQANFIDTGSGAVSRTFSAVAATDYVIDAVEIIPKTVEPDPTPTPSPGGGSTRGGGVGRRPSDDEIADWTLKYYTLNGYKYGAYYANKVVNTSGDSLYTDDAIYLSMTSIPMANGTYTVNIPSGFLWIAYTYDSASGKAVPLRDGNWAANGVELSIPSDTDVIFSFKNSSGDSIAVSDVTLSLVNPTIVEYEPGGDAPSSPTPTPDPGGDTPTPTPVPTTPPDGGGSGGPGGSSNPLGGLLGALGDLLLGLLQSFLNLIWTLISTILAIFLWCGQQVSVLIPFLPAPALGALLGGIVLVFIIKLIHFIGGLF